MDQQDWYLLCRVIARLFLILDFETAIPGWPKVFGNQDVAEPISGFDLSKKSGVESEEIQELTPLGWFS